MPDHRIRLTDDDIALIVASLRARAAMTSGDRLARIRRLIDRLGDGGAGNPQWRFGPGVCMHGVALYGRCVDCLAAARQFLT